MKTLQNLPSPSLYTSVHDERTCRSRNVEPQHQGTAGMMAAFFLITGIFVGVVFSLPVTMFIQSVGPGYTAPIAACIGNITMPC